MGDHCLEEGQKVDMKNAPSLIVALVAVTTVAQCQSVFDAVRSNDLPAVQALVEKEPKVLESRDAGGMTPLHFAALWGSAELVNYLIDSGAKLELQDAQTKTPLHRAAVNDRSDIVAVLLRRGAAIEARDDYLRTPLLLCARERGQVATARILIEAGADVNAVDKFGAGSLSLAVWRGKRELVDLLLEKGARVPESAPERRGMLSEAASRGLETLFRRLTGEGEALTASDAWAESLLHVAAQGGAVGIVDLLLKKGFDPRRPDRFGWTPLHYAARDGRTEAARLLVDSGAPLNARTSMGQSAYNVAVARGMQSLATLLAEKGADQSEIQFPALEGDYLGQKPPAGRAELFAPGIVSSIWGLHSTAIFTPDGNEVYWKPMITYPDEIYSRGGLVMMRRLNGRWMPPTWAPFSGPDVNDDVPFFSPKGEKVYFISSRPLPGESGRGNERIWLADRTATGWSEPRPLDTVVNSANMHWAFSLDREGNVYFGGQGPDSRGSNDIYLARFRDGKYERPVNMGAPINSRLGENTPFIAPDGSYLLFSREYDLWVSFPGEGSTWSEPVRLGPEVNSPSIELCPMVTADGKFLFFLSQRGGESHAYWVSADVIQKARPAKASRDREGSGMDEFGQIEQSIRNCIGWAKNKDFRLLYSVIANDEDFLEVHPDGAVVKGFEDFRKAETLWGSPDFKAVRYEIRDLRIKLSQSRDVAWFFCLLDDINEWQGRPANWENTRWTGVLEKREGRWIMVQQHFSFASKQ
jgi:ankyrin repeat protein/Tol biopolymer transport system component